MGAERLVGVTVPYKYIMGIAEVKRNELVCCADLCKLAAGDNGSCGINNADNTVHSISHLMY